MESIDEIRDGVVAWARSYGILTDSFPGGMAPTGKVELAPFAPEDAEFFRQPRRIARVVGSGNTLTLSTRVKIAETKVRKLQQKFTDRYGKDGYKLAVDVSKHFKVDQRLDTFGRLSPIKWLTVSGQKSRIACGSSIGLGNQRNAGTLTALARVKGDKDQLFAISCNHVIGGCSTALPGTPIVVPGIQDVTSDYPEIHVVGLHDRTANMSQGLPSLIDISQNHDLAVFVVNQPELITSMQGEGENAFDTPTKFAPPTVDMEVKKWGRSTGLTKGVIVAVNSDPEPIEYNVTSYFGPMRSEIFRGTVYFERVFEVRSMGAAPFSLGGDSGALVVDRTGKSVIGVVVAGGGEKSLVLPIDGALKSLGLVLVSGHNV
jgi:hypothetical protein